MPLEAAIGQLVAAVIASSWLVAAISSRDWLTKCCDFGAERAVGKLSTKLQGNSGTMCLETVLVEF